MSIRASSRPMFLSVIVFWPHTTSKSRQASTASLENIQELPHCTSRLSVTLTLRRTHSTASVGMTTTWPTSPTTRACSLCFLQSTSLQGSALFAPGMEKQVRRREWPSPAHIHREESGVTGHTTFWLLELFSRYLYTYFPAGTTVLQKLYSVFGHACSVQPIPMECRQDEKVGGAGSDLVCP